MKTWRSLLRMWYNFMGAAGARGRNVQGRRSPVELSKSGPGGSLVVYFLGHLLSFNYSDSGFFWTPALTFFKNGVNDFGQFSSYSTSTGLFVFSVLAQSFVIERYLGVMLSGAGRSQKKRHFEHAISFVGHAGAGFEFSALPHSRIEAAVAHEVSGRREPLYVSHFGEDDRGGDLSYARNSGKGLVRKILAEEVLYFPINFVEEAVLFEDLRGEGLDHELFGKGELLEGGLFSEGEELAHMSGSGAMFGADTERAQAIFTGLKNEVWRGESSEAGQKSCGEFTASNFLVAGEVEAEEVMEAVFEGGAGLDDEASETGEGSEAEEVEGRLIRGTGLEAEEVEGDGVSVEPVGFGAGEESFGEVSDGSGIEFMDLNSAAALGLEDAKETEVMVSSSFKATEDSGVRATEISRSHESGSQSGPAFRGVGEGAERTERMTLGIQESDHQFFGAHVYTGIKDVFHLSSPLINWLPDVEFSRFSARPNLLNEALLAQIVIKALGRDGRSQSPYRGLTPANMKAFSSTSRPREFYSLFLNNKQSSQQLL